MKLAEAILLRADTQKKIERIQQRLNSNVIVSEGQTPQEDPDKLLAQLRNSIQEFEAIVVKINRTNNETLIDGQMKLMEALAKRDALKLLVEKLRIVQQSATINRSHYTSISPKSTIDFSKLQAEIDQVARSFREIDNKIQQVNWQTELID